MKLIATSDWHVDAVTAGYPRGQGVMNAVDEAVNRAIALEADLFVFGGDLCDPDPHRNARIVAFAIATAHRLARAGIPSRWLTGNHDVIEDGSGTSVLEPMKAAGDGGVWAVWDRPMVERLVGTTFIALPYVPRAAAYDPEEFVRSIEMSEPPSQRIVVVSHLNVAGVVPESETKEMPRGREVWLPLSAIRQRWPHATVLQGHYHRGQVTADGVCIIGTLERLTFGEADNACGWVEDQGSGPRHWTRQPRQLVTIGRDHPLWTGTPLDRDGVTGALVRVQPPAMATDDQIGAVLEMLDPLAVGVKLEPRLAAKAPINPAVEPAKAQAVRTLRGVVTEVADALLLPMDDETRPAMMALIEQVMSEENL